MRITGGIWKSRKIVTKNSDKIRPTTDRIRESLFSILESSHVIDLQNIRVLDLFAGTGALGFESLSRGAKYCLFVENSAEARMIILRNTEILNASDCSKIYRRDAMRLGVLSGNIGLDFNLIFLDPPYGRSLGEKALISARKGHWFARDAMIVLEESEKAVINVPEGFKEIDRRFYGNTMLIFMILECVFFTRNHTPSNIFAIKSL